MYFIFDLTGAPCQCTVLINRVESPERPSFSPILFQQTRGSVQSRREVFRIQEHSLEVSLCVWRSSNQQMQNIASVQGFQCTQEWASTHNHAFKKLRTKFTYAVNTLRFIKWNMSLQTCWHIETDSHTHTRAQTVQPLKHQPLVQNLIWNFLWVRISENGVAIKAALVQYLWIKPGLNSRD